MVIQVVIVVVVLSLSNFGLGGVSLIDLQWTFSKTVTHTEHKHDGKNEIFQTVTRYFYFLELQQNQLKGTIIELPFSVF